VVKCKSVAAASLSEWVLSIVGQEQDGEPTVSDTKELKEIPEEEKKNAE